MVTRAMPMSFSRFFISLTHFSDGSPAPAVLPPGATGCKDNAILQIGQAHRLFFVCIRRCGFVLPLTCLGGAAVDADGFWQGMPRRPSRNGSRWAILSFGPFCIAAWAVLHCHTARSALPYGPFPNVLQASGLWRHASGSRAGWPVDVLWPHPVQPIA